MFENITIRHQNTTTEDRPLDIGFLLECLVFYTKVTVIADRNILRQLIPALGFAALNELLERNTLELLYTDKLTGVVTNTLPGGLQLHNASVVSSPIFSLHDNISKICIEHSGKTGKGRRHASRIERKIKIVKLDDSMAEAAKSLFLDNDFMSRSVPRLVNEWIGGTEIPQNISFRTEETAQGILVDSNLNYDFLNAVYQKRNSIVRPPLTTAYILATIFGAETDLYFASRQLSEIATSAISSSLLELRLTHLAERCLKSKRQKDSFQDLIFNGQKTIREAYNAGQIRLEDILAVIYRAEKFKAWLAKQDVDANLLQAYLGEVTKESPLDRLSAKSVRWSLFTGAGVLADIMGLGEIGTIGGIALSFIDGFVLDKLIHGWKPSQFVGNELKRLINDQA